MMNAEQCFIESVFMFKILSTFCELLQSNSSNLLRSTAEIFTCMDSVVAVFSVNSGQYI